MTAVTIAITLTLAARPLGTPLLFGYMADSMGRRLVLIINVLTFHSFRVCVSTRSLVIRFHRSPLAPEMASPWGSRVRRQPSVATMESIPAKWRGAASKLLGMTIADYLLASLLYWVAFSAVGWRMLFIISCRSGTLRCRVYLLVRGIAGLAATQGAGRSRHVAGDRAICR